MKGKLDYRAMYLNLCHRIGEVQELLEEAISYQTYTREQLEEETWKEAYLSLVRQVEGTQATVVSKEVGV